MQPGLKRWNVYELTLGAMNASASDTDSFTVETDYFFVVFMQQAFVYDANGLGVSTLQRPLITVTMQQGSNNQNLQNQAVAVDSVFGDGRNPYVLPVPHVIAGGQTFNVTATNNHSATAYSVRLSWSGVLVYKTKAEEYLRSVFGN